MRGGVRMIDGTLTSRRAFGCRPRSLLPAAPPHAQASQRLIDQVCPVARSGNAQPSRPTARGQHRAGCQRSLPQTQAHLPGSRAEKASSGDTHLSASQFLGKRLLRKTLDTFLMLLRLA